MNTKTGIWLALLAGIISGISIFVNKFALTGFNPFQFTFLKNLIVIIALLGFFALFWKWKEFKKLGFKRWKQLVLIGFIGGSIPFLLFFYGLKLTNAINANFIHKLLFVFVSIIAFFVLREKFEKKIVIGIGLTLIGLFLLTGMELTGFNIGDPLILIATILWSIEIVLSKKILKELSTGTVVFGRMFFGAIFILVFLLATNQLPSINVIADSANLFWLVITSIFLLAYVGFFYSALKRIKAGTSALLITIGVPITFALTISKTTPFFALQLLGIGLIAIGTIVCVWVEKNFAAKKSAVS